VHGEDHATATRRSQCVAPSGRSPRETTNVDPGTPQLPERTPSCRQPKRLPSTSTPYADSLSVRLTSSGSKPARGITGESHSARVTSLHREQRLAAGTPPAPIRRRLPPACGLPVLNATPHTSQ
jgi:hypothetical protein